MDNAQSPFYRLDMTERYCTKLIYDEVPEVLGAAKGGAVRRLWVILDRDEASSNSRHVGCAPESGSKISLLASASVGLCDLMVPPGT